ncbi:hypothetical protein EV178_001867 [Coemansia sp. RSA 1646]|nr:hypothetical protein EV178_001867 [Coemansia sp. RSA 1646]KAJ2093043.1 hypothetical protein IW138_000757 [Coemansia sp. RSA 986]
MDCHCRTLEERECCRRLVQFWRRHENNNIFCTFKAVAAADRVPNSIVVSCIYWEEKQDFFITSVDCIHLLESLIAVRFTVEEKNRIRRNLEGFRPLTVSKCKSESADFFKLIMSFPNPKPRNIEKDVKVFPWRILPLALKKIIGKYTASYSSTASIALDAYPSSRSTCYSRLTGMPISTSAGGMATFGALTSSPGSMLGASSASAAVVAAAAAAAEKSRLSASMPVTIRQSAANTSSLSAHANAGPDSGFEPLSMNDVSSTKIKGIHMTAHSAMASAASVPASDSSDQDYGSLLSSRDSKSKMTRPATTPYISNAGDGKDSYTEAIKNPGNADQLGIPSFMLSQGCTSQLDFAGMAANNPMPFLASDMPDQQVSAAQLYSSTNLLNQLAAGYGFSGSDYTLQLPESQDSRSTQSDTSVSSQPPPQQQQQQRVARSSSAKRNVMQHTPYSTERADRRKAENYRGSPSIPLILEQQQQHNVHHDANIFNSLVNIETSSAASSTTTFGEPSSADGASRHVGNNTSSKENGVHPPVYGALKKALLGPSGETADRKADPPPDDQQSAGGNDTAKGSCGSSVSMLEPGMFDTAAASASAEMFNFGLDGDFSFLANLIAASGGGGSSSSLATAPYDNGEIGLSPSSSNNTMAPEVPSEGDAQTTDVFSLVHLPGGQALGTIDGHGRSDQKNQQQQRQQWMEGGNNGRGDAEPRPIAASDIAQMGIQMAKSGILSGSAIEQMLSPATTPSQDGHQLHTSGSNLSVPAAASGSVALVGVHGPSQPQEPLFCADMFGGGKMQQPHMLDRRAHGL